MDRQANRALDAADQAMRDLRAQIEHQERLASLGTAASLIVHEFRNLLAPLRSYAQLALMKPNDQELVRKALVRAVECSDHAAEIADVILSFSRPDPPTPQLAETDELADVQTAIDRAVHCLVRDPAKDNIKIHVDVPPGTKAGLRLISLQHLVLNLILNARSAMLPRGGTLRIYADVGSKPGWLTAWNGSAWNNGDWTCLTVEDTGRGMSAAQARDIFEPFVTMNANQSGIGLGMVVCKRLVEEAGGGIKVDSTPGRGTRVHVALPSGHHRASLRECA